VLVLALLLKFEQTILCFQGFSAETSGGLLIALSKEDAEKFCAVRKTSQITFQGVKLYFN